MFIENLNLVCPNTEKECAFYHFCAGQKEIFDEGGAQPGSIVAQLYDHLPEGIYQVLETKWCSNERIIALGAIAANSESESRERISAERLIRSIARRRIDFLSQ